MSFVCFILSIPPGLDWTTDPCVGQQGAVLDTFIHSCAENKAHSPNLGPWMFWNVSAVVPLGRRQLSHQLCCPVKCVSECFVAFPLHMWLLRPLMRRVCGDVAALWPPVCFPTCSFVCLYTFFALTWENIQHMQKTEAHFMFSIWSMHRNSGWTASPRPRRPAGFFKWFQVTIWIYIDRFWGFLFLNAWIIEKNSWTGFPLFTQPCSLTSALFSCFPHHFVYFRVNPD